MSGIGRRGFIAVAASMPLAMGRGGASLSAAPIDVRSGRVPLLLHDAMLESGRRFADRAARNRIASRAIEGDRVRQVRDMLRDRPHAVWGVSRFADEILVHEVAREAGYRRIAVIRHECDDGVVACCSAGADSLQTLAAAAGRGWPEAFADLALGATPRRATQIDPPASAGMSWVLMRVA